MLLTLWEWTKPLRHNGSLFGFCREIGNKFEEIYRESDTTIGLQLVRAGIFGISIFNCYQSKIDADKSKKYKLSRHR